MKFRIAPNVLGVSHTVDITSERFEELRRSRAVLSESLAIEQKYEVLLRNYEEFEKEILGKLSNELTRGLSNHLDYYENVLAFNFRLINLLASAKLYTEQAPKHAGRCFEEYEQGKAETKAVFSKEYDSNMSYRFMEELRNHVTHSELPVHGVSIGRGWTDIAGDTYFEHTVAIKCIKEKLAGDKRFKKKVLAEIPDSVDLATAVRSYMSSLSNVHMEVRALLRAATMESRCSIATAIDEFCNGAVGRDESPAALGLHVWRDESGKVVESFPLLLSWDDVRLKLVERNRRLANLCRRHVTGRSGDKDALQGQAALPT